MTIEEIDTLIGEYGYISEEFARSESIFNICPCTEHASHYGIKRREAIIAREKLIEAIKQYKEQK